jgi:hypothetical protein
MDDHGDGVEAGDADVLVPFMVARDDYEASLIAGRLEEAGIGSRLIKEHDAVGGFIYKGYDPTAPVAVLVPRSQLHEAQTLLGSLDSERAARDDRAAEHEPIDTPRPAFPRLWVWIAAMLVLGSLALLVISLVLDHFGLFS